MPPVYSAAFEVGGSTEQPRRVALPTFDRAETLRRYLNGDCRGAADLIYEMLVFHAKYTHVIETPALQEHIDSFVETVLYLMTKPDFKIPVEMGEAFLTTHQVFANLVALSRFHNTDPQLAILERQPDNFVKLLFLYSVYNKIHIPPKMLFDGNAYMASVWYSLYPLSAPGMPSELTWQNIRRHAEYVDPRLIANGHRMVGFYFGCTYVHPDGDRALKAQWNQDIRRQIAGIRLTNRPQRDSVAIVTGKWYPQSAVYKTSFPFIRSLKDRYRLTLVHLGNKFEGLDTSLFESVRCVKVTDAEVDCREIAENDFQMAYFPDIGMNAESIWLANLRIAPVQMAGYGHPVTTGGSEIDYFLGGQDCELPERAEQNYAERLVLIPGIGLHSTYPPYTPTLPELATDAIVLNLPWSINKVNYPLLKLLRTIQQRSSKPLKLQFLPGSALNRYNAVIPFMRSIGDLFGDRANVYINRPYAEFMSVMEKGHFSLDSYPFGGYNMVIDSVYLGKPMVTREGTRIYNRCSSALMRKIGLDELVARSDEEYVAKALRLIEDDDYRNALSQRLRETDLRQRVFDTLEPEYFGKAIDYLIDNHDRLQADPSRAPITIG